MKTHYFQTFIACLRVLFISLLIFRVGQASNLGIWEKVYGVSGNVDVQDFDSDGQSNEQEKLAGTDPYDGSSFFAPEHKAYYSKASYLSWNAKPNVLYQVQRSHTLNAQEWEPLGGKLAVAGGELRQLVELDSNHGFYRIKIPYGVNSEFNSMIHLGSQDVDGDGIEDIEEILFGTNPFDPKSLVSPPKLENGTVTIIGVS